MWRLNFVNVKPSKSFQEVVYIFIHVDQTSSAFNHTVMRLTTRKNVALATQTPFIPAMVLFLEAVAGQCHRCSGSPWVQHQPVRSTLSAMEFLSFSHVFCHVFFVFFCFSSSSFFSSSSVWFILLLLLLLYFFHFWGVFLCFFSSSSFSLASSSHHYHHHHHHRHRHRHHYHYCHRYHCSQGHSDNDGDRPSLVMIRIKQHHHKIHGPHPGLAAFRQLGQDRIHLITL